MMKIYETDWLGCNPIFYNTKTGKVSHNINDAIDFRNLEFHPEGLNNYFDFGYSVFEQTPVKYVKFLRHSSKLIKKDNGKIEIHYLNYSTEKLIGKDSNSKEEDVIDLIREKVQKWESSVNGEIIIPTSGGHDSRLLCSMIKDKSRIRSFSYGLSNNQSESFEVVYAQRLSEILGIKWEQIQLGEFHKYFDEWDKLYGVSTHATGMYHIEFYKKIIDRLGLGKSLLSGIIGSSLAGHLNIPIINNIKELNNLGYTHGLNADSSQSLLKSDNYLLENYFLKNKDKLKDDRFRIMESIRFKIILLSYLLKMPRHLSFKVWSPFHLEDVAISMLNLPKERRENRKWQIDFFRKNKINLEDMGLKVDYRNVLNLYAIKKVTPKPLDINILKEVLNQNYLEWINSKITQCYFNIIFDNTIAKLMNVPKIGGLMRRIGFKTSNYQVLRAYCAYLTIKPIENLIIKRNLT